MRKPGESDTILQIAEIAVDQTLRRASHLDDDTYTRLRAVAAQTVPIDPLMPGWLLRPEVSFRAKIPFNNKRKRTLEGVIWNDFTPQQYTYLDEASILRNLGSIFGDPEDRKA